MSMLLILDERIAFMNPTDNAQEFPDGEICSYPTG